MSSKQFQKSLGTLIDLRSRELEKRQAELAQKQALSARVEATIERLDQLLLSIGSSNTMTAGQALNAGAYKQSLLQMAERQRQDLCLKKADVSSAQTAVQASARQQEVLGQVLQQSVQRAHIARERQTQKQQDDLATQVWMRGQA